MNLTKKRIDQLLSKLRMYYGTRIRHLNTLLQPVSILGVVIAVMATMVVIAAWLALKLE